MILKRMFVGWLLIMTVSACGLLDGFGAEMADCAEMGVQYAAPDYVTVVDESCTSGMGPGNVGYEATFKIAPGDVETFQASTGLTAWTADMAQADVFEDEAARVQSGLLATFGDGAYLREVLIDTSDAAEYTVYYYHAFVD